MGTTGMGTTGITGLDVRPVGGSLGAEVRGIDLRSVDAADVAELKDLLHDYEVLFFPGAGLDEDEHMALGRMFGEIAIFPMSRLFGATEPKFQTIIDGPDSPPTADAWHTDVTWTAEPPDYALLMATVVPERGGDTLWASMTAAYDGLSPTMQAMITGLEVVHDNSSFIEAARWKTKSGGGDEKAVDELMDRLRAEYPPVVHPLVRTHPDTGRRALFLGGGFMRRIVGLHDDESRTILDLLARHIDDARYQVRWRWTPGDLAIWDERSTNHRSAGDHFPQHRSIRRIEITGTRPSFDPDRIPAARTGAGGH
jgi:taurine dioxygenase